MRKIYTFCVLFSLLTFTHTCSPNYRVPNLQSAALTLTPRSYSPDPTQSYPYSFSTPFANIPTLALGLPELSLAFLAPHSLTLTPTQVTTASLMLELDCSAGNWVLLRVIFWASTNSEVQVGFFRVDNLQFSSNSAVVYSSIFQSFPATINPIVRIFLNGYDAVTPALNLSIAGAQLTQTRLAVKITVGSNCQLKRIALSFLVFVPNSDSFGSFGGIFQRSDFNQLATMDISSSLYQSPYVIYGVTQISVSGTQPVSFSCSISSKFLLTASSSRLLQAISVIYVVLGVVPSKLCTQCGDRTIAYEKECVSSCPAGTTEFVYRDGGVCCKDSQSDTTSIAIEQTQTQPPLQQVLPLPQTQTQSQPAQSPQTDNLAIYQYAPPAKICSSNAFFNGDECVCVVGFVEKEGRCDAVKAARSISINPNFFRPTALIGSATCSSSRIFNSSSSPQSSILTLTPTIVANQCQNINQIWNGSLCICIQGYKRINGQCQLISTSTSSPSFSNPPLSPLNPPTSNPLSLLPTQLPSIQPKQSSLPSSIVCPPNAFDNGLGCCVCNLGYFMFNQTCIKGAPCQANSNKQPDGSCQCIAGFTNYNGTCSRCASGAYWSSAVSKCIYVCGQNAVYSSQMNSCTCNPGYGNMNGQCSVCPTDYFIHSGYCVTCPLNAIYNSAMKVCDCRQGFYMDYHGMCTRKCGTNQLYDSAIQDCVCVKGLGRISGVCQFCPVGSSLTPDGVCSNCGANQQLLNGRCVCQVGFALNSGRVCTACSQLGGFVVDGVCSVCPKNLVSDGAGGCRCPAGKSLQNYRCVSQCLVDQLIDDRGNCYTCGANQFIIGGECRCAAGYVRNGCGSCTLNCGSNQFYFRGSCAVCPLNTVYNPTVNGCTCPSGFYMDTYGICQKLQLQPIDCPSTQYYDSQLGCVACNLACKSCKSATQCLTCSLTGYSPNSYGVCAPQCGDGIIVGAETCDTGSAYSQGCQGCQIQNSYQCSGQPSLCRQASTTPVTPLPNPTPSNSSTSALYQSGSTNINSNNVFISLKTNPTFTFSSPTEMQSFLTSTFSAAPKPTVYCAQRNSPSLETFDCLLIYPSGVPNKPFTVTFSYNFQGKTGSAAVYVNPLASNSRKSDESSIKSSRVSP